MNTRTVQSGVLVIGGGLAGTRAALAARRAGAAACIALKGKLGTSGNSPLAGGGFNAALRLADPADSPEVHFADTMAGGSGVNNAALVRTLAEQAPAAILELQKMGVAFAMAGDQITQYRTPAGSHRRAARTAGGASFKMMDLLAEAVRREGVQVVEEVTLSDLLISSGAVAGAAGYSPEEDALIVFLAGATVLACGGAGQLFPLTSNHPEITGDGYAMAYRAGARLADMEFVQFSPTALAWPLQMRGSSTGGSLLGQEGAKLLNRLGERFMIRYDPERMERSTRAITAKAMYREIVEGRGTEHGAIYLDVTEVDRTALENISGPPIRELRRRGVDPLKQPIEVAPAVHHCMGGVIIETDCRTDVPRLFAAGEVAAGVHGANRLNSNGLSEAAVFGAIAGREAAAYVSSGPEIPATGSGVDRARAELEAMAKPGLPAEPFVERLRSIMLAGAGLERRAKDIHAALSDLEKLRAEAAGVGAEKPAELPRAIELRNMLEVGEVILRAALLRTESRGAHYRSDFPRPDDAEWLANIQVTRGRSGPEFQIVPIKL